MKQILTIILLSLTPYIQAVEGCPKCSIELVKEVMGGLDSLNFQQTSNFLCTLDQSCDVNVEFSEWSNEAIFKLLHLKTELFLAALAAQPPETQEIVLQQIKHPIHDFNLDKIYQNVETATFEGKIKGDVLVVLSAVAGKMK